jgi:hypothetical protein
MISLRQLASDESLGPPEFGECLPPPDVPPPLDPLPPFVASWDRLQYCLRSSNQGLVVWALSCLPAECERQRRILQLVPLITQLFTHHSRLVELSAIMCINTLLNSFGKNIIASILQNVLDRFDQVPALEYVLCLSKIIPALTEVTLMSCVLPLVDRFLTRGESFQWAVGHMLLSVPFSVWGFGADFFSKLFFSPLLVNDFMPSLIRMAAQGSFFSDDWATRTFPAQLVQAAGHNRSIRIGVTKVLLSLSAVLSPKAMFGSIAILLQWASESVEVAFLLLAHADELVTPRTVELFPKLRELFQRLAHSRDPRIRIQLPGILAGNPNVFLQGGLQLEKLIVELARDRNPDIRLAALTNFVVMCDRTADKASQDAFFRVFPEFFVNPLPEVRNRLCSSRTYGSFGVVRLQSLVPTFLKFMSSLTLWRNIRDCVEAILSFPGETMRVAWPVITLVVFQAVAQNPHPLVKACCAFCESLAKMIEPDEFVEFADMLIDTFANHAQWAVRRLFAILVGGLAGNRRIEMRRLDLNALFGALVRMAQDSNLAVRIAMVNQMCCLRLFFSERQDGQRERDLVTLFMRLAKSADPYLTEAWEMVSPKFNAVGAKKGLPALQDGSPGWRSRSVAQFGGNLKAHGPLQRMTSGKAVPIGVSRSFFKPHTLLTKQKILIPVSDPGDTVSGSILEDDGG